MPLVLALEPDPRQAAALKPILERRVGAELVLADSKDSAIAALAERIPDLILVTALLSPRDEAELNDHLRSLEGAEHVQTLTIPLLSSPARQPSRRKRGLLGALRSSEPKTPVSEGCDPAEFAEQIKAYIERAGELKAEARAAALRAVLRNDSHADAAVSSDGNASRSGAGTTSGASSSYWSWDAPPAPVTPEYTPRVPAEALAELEGAGISAHPWDDPDILPQKLDEHEAGVVEAAERLLRQPAPDEAPLPADAFVTLDARYEEDAAAPAVDFDEGSQSASTVAPGSGEAPEVRWLLRAEPDAESSAPPDVDCSRSIASSEAEHREDERALREAQERERPDAEAFERNRLARDEADRAEFEAERERLARETQGRERLEAEAIERERIAREEAERARQEAAERERLAREAEARERAALELVAREQAERERIAREAEERERVARAEAEQARLEAEEQARQARDAEERERLARERAQRERIERQRAEREAKERERLARDTERRERIA
ncbi:MAG TPA: hypothetical protein VNK41_10285, partial [Vicinamibacterales bacterium]|nr:hypothetical protein [Vicinamibacterales bacterium]